MFPEVRTNCDALRDLRKQMRKLWAAVRQGEKPGSVFFDVAQERRNDAIILAAQMREHVRGCNVCCEEGALEEQHFYGVYPLPRVKYQ